MTAKQVVVIGGGIAGLTTAYRIEQALSRRGVDAAVNVFEAGPQAGGNIRSEEVDGFTVEWGPNGFLDNVPATLELVRDLALDEELQRADPRAATRYIWRRSRLHPIPTGPLSFLGSRALSLTGRLRVLAEPFQARGPDARDESVRDFGVRRIGTEATDVLIDAMVSGVFAGTAETLSLSSAFPKMRAMESEHGSLVRAMLARKRHGSGGGPAGPGGTLTSFRNGMETLPRALARHLGSRLHTGVRATGIPGQDAEGRWRVALDGVDEVAADQVVLAVPAPRSAELTAEVSPALSEVLGSMPTAGLAVVALAYPESALVRSPDGFGFLVPRSEGIRILGCLRDSTIFPGRAPEGHVLLRAMIGGAYDPEAVGLPADELEHIVRAELSTTLGVDAQPSLVRVLRHPLGIGQYTVGHADRLERIGNALAELPGLSLTGSSYRGVSMNACIERASLEAESIADRVAEAARPSTTTA